MAFIVLLTAWLTGNLWRRFDECTGVELVAFFDGLSQNVDVALSVITFPGQWAKFLLQQLPRFDFGEEVEEDNSEDGLFRRLVTLFNHLGDEILRYFVEDPVGVAEEVVLHDLVVCPPG